MRRWLASLQRRCPNALYAFLLKRGIVAAPVDLARWLAERIAEGDFSVLGEAPSESRCAIRIDDDLARVVARIHEIPGLAHSDHPFGALKGPNPRMDEQART